MCGVKKALQIRFHNGFDPIVAAFVSAKIEAFLVQPALPILPFFFGLIEIDVNKRASV